MVAFFNAKAAAPSLTKMNDYLKTKNYAGHVSIPVMIKVRNTVQIHGIIFVNMSRDMLIEKSMRP